MNNIPFISKNLIATEYTLTATASRIIKPSFERDYIITNLSLNENLIKNVAHYSATINSDTYTYNSVDPIDVRNFNEAHIYVIASAAAGGTWEMYAMTQDDYSDVWIAAPLIFTNINSNNDNTAYYALLNKEALSNNLAFYIRRIFSTVNLGITIGVTLKGGVGNASNNVANMAYIGSSNNVTATSGHPILPNSEFKFRLEKDTEIWGIGGNIVTNVLCKVTIL